MGRQDPGQDQDDRRARGRQELDEEQEQLRVCVKSPWAAESYLWLEEEVKGRERDGEEGWFWRLFLEVRATFSDGI